jgi:hypothetical protein
MVSNNLFFVKFLCYLLFFVDAWATCNMHCDEGREYWGKCEKDIYFHYSTMKCFTI